MRLEKVALALVVVLAMWQSVDAGACAGACQPNTDYCPSSYKSGSQLQTKSSVDLIIPHQGTALAPAPSSAVLKV